MNALLSPSLQRLAGITTKTKQNAVCLSTNYASKQCTQNTVHNNTLCALPGRVINGIKRKPTGNSSHHIYKHPLAIFFGCGGSHKEVYDGNVTRLSAPWFAN